MDDEDEDEVARRKRALRRALGCTLAIVAGMCFTASDFVLKTFTLDFCDVLLVRSVLQVKNCI